MKSLSDFSPTYYLPETHRSVREVLRHADIPYTKVIAQVFDLVLSALWARGEAPCSMRVEFAAPQSQQDADKLVLLENEKRPAVLKSKERLVRLHSSEHVLEYCALLTRGCFTTERGAQVVHDHLASISALNGAACLTIAEFVQEKVAQKLRGIKKRDPRWVSLDDFLEHAFDGTTCSSEMLIMSGKGAPRIEFDPHYPRWLLESFFVVYVQWLQDCVDDEDCPNIWWRGCITVIC